MNTGKLDNFLSKRIQHQDDYFNNKKNKMEKYNNVSTLR